MTVIRTALAAGLVLLAPCAALANDPFSITATVTTPNVSTGSAQGNTITDIVNQLKSQNLTALTQSYTDQSAATATLNLRGVSTTATYTVNSTTLRFQVPGAGIDQSFTGATRNDSQHMLLEFLLKGGGGATTALLQALVASSPLDPVAGNPSSSENAMSRADFGIGTGIGLGGAEIPGQGQPKAGLLGQPNLIGAGGEVGFVHSGGFDGVEATLPIRYTFALPDPRYAITVDIPITYLSYGSTSSYFGSFGASLRIPITDNWYITPALRGGASGSVDLGAAALQYSGSVTSRYDLFFGDLALTVGNGLTVSKTAPLSVGSVHVSYDITNELITNGLQAEGSLPFTVFGEPTSWQAYVVDTFVEGSKVYVSHYDEIGFTVGTRHPRNSQDWQSLRVGLGVTAGAHYNAVKLGLLYRF